MGKVIAFPTHRIQPLVAATAPQVTPAPKVDAPAGLHGYYPEMGDAKPACQIEARLSYGKWWVKVPSGVMLHGRGIKYMHTYRAQDLTPEAQHKVGWKIYEVTMKAMDKLKQQYSVGSEILLD
jgi:hypothetical protein